MRKSKFVIINSFTWFLKKKKSKNEIYDWKKFYNLKKKRMKPPPPLKKKKKKKKKRMCYYFKKNKYEK